LQAPPLTDDQDVERAAIWVSGRHADMPAVAFSGTIGGKALSDQHLYCGRVEVDSGVGDPLRVAAWDKHFGADIEEKVVGDLGIEPSVRLREGVTVPLPHLAACRPLAG